jgi:fatty acid desaturase
MRPRFASDYRTLFWTFVLFPLLPALSYARPGLLLWLLPLQLYLSFCAGVLTHNQVHFKLFPGRRANLAYASWLSIFYGSPINAWIPTHLLNHHRYPDQQRDVTRSHRLSRDHNLWQALRYSLLCGAWELPLVLEYARRARQRQDRAWHELRLQLAAVVLAHAAALALALSLHGAALGSAVYLLTLGSAFIAPNLMFFTNYIQHVHCDAESPHDYCRNFVSPIANWLVFQNGYHTVHHDQPSAHWSQYPALHAARSASIHPSLNQRSLIAFCVANYLLRPLSARWATMPLKTEPLQAPPQQPAPASPLPLGAPLPEL